MQYSSCPDEGECASQTPCNGMSQASNDSYMRCMTCDTQPGLMLVQQQALPLWGSADTFVQASVGMSTFLPKSGFIFGFVALLG